MRFCFIAIALLICAVLATIVVGDELHKVEAYAEPYTPAFRVNAFGYEGMFR